MAAFMKLLNNVSRSQAIYRKNRIAAEDLQSVHYAYLLAVCKKPGSSQEEIARELCVNKSTVTRNLNYLEENGYILRTPQPADKRHLAVYPTEKLEGIIPQIRAASREWMELLSEGIPQDQLEIFNSVLLRMQEKAGAIINEQEENK